jgi:branched-chain amino acid transport system permease protein
VPGFSTSRRRSAETLPGIYRGWQFVSGLGFALVLWLLGYVFGGSENFTILQTWMIYTTLALSFYVVFSVGGLFAFSLAGFFGIGAYLSPYMYDRMTYVLALLVVLAIGSAIAFLLVVLVRRASDLYLGIATLGFAEILTVVYPNWQAVTGVSGNLYGIKPISFFGSAVVNPRPTYWLTAAGVVALYFLIAAMQRSTFGRNATAMRTSPEVAAVNGIDARRVRIVLFVVGSAFAVFAGSLFAHTQSYVSPESADVTVSITVFIIVIIGGARYIWSAPLGALLVVVLPLKITSWANYANLGFALLLVVMIIFAPGGLAGIPGYLRRRIWRA